MELAVKRLLEENNINCSITGLYLGLLNKDESGYRELNALGYVYDYRRNEQFDSTLVYGFNGLIEIFFSATHGSVKKYVEEAGNIIPELEPAEEANIQAIQDIQNGALAFVRDFTQQISGYRIELSAEDAYKKFERMLIDPTKDELDLFGNLKFYDVYSRRLIDYKSLSYYIRHPRNLVKDLIVSDWKCGFIKRILPCFVKPATIYKLMLKINV